ncbi:hypothetical protein ABQE69_09195 [Mycolicibacillus trivialis]
MSGTDYPSIQSLTWLRVESVHAIRSRPGLFSVRLADGTSITTTAEQYDEFDASVRAGIASAQAEAVAS